MTVAEFLDWEAGEPSGAAWQLRDGEPEMMAPGSDAHGSIQGELHRLIENHLIASGSHCRSVIAPGVVPRLRSDRNMLVPDLGITCTPPTGSRAIPDPVVLVEVISPSDESQTRGNVWAYTTIPSGSEILVISSTAVTAEVLRRQADGTWPEQPEIIGPQDELRLQAIDFAVPLKAPCRMSGLL